jgi:biuret amidohydrolase
MEKQMLQVNGLTLPRSMPELVNPLSTALVVYDMQVGILRQIQERERLIGQVQRLLELARRAAVRTFFTRHTSLPVELMGAMQWRTALAWQRTEDPGQVKSVFLRDAPATQLLPELQPLSSEAVFDKICMSAFEGTPLNIALRDCRITTVILCGVALEIGLEPTARHAADLGYVPVLVRDACGHGDAQAAERSLAALAFAGQTVQTEVEQLQQAWEQRP